MKKTYKKHKKYFVKDYEDGISIINDEYFDDIKSWTEALSIGFLCYFEIQKILTDDALSNDDAESFIGNMKVVTGLNRTLQELDFRFPEILNTIHGNAKIRC